MKPHADNRETFYSETQRDHNLGKKENTFNYAKKYQDLQDRLLKMGTAFMLLEDIFHGEYPHICEKCESIALSYITEFSFTCGMSLKEEREMLYHALLCLDTSEKILSTLLSLGKITAMNFSLINAEIESISLRVRSLYETNEERLLSQTGSNFSKNNSNSFSLEKLEALFQKKEAKETVKEETEEGVLQEKQIELNTNYQFIKADKFYKKDAVDTNRTFDSFESQYEYFRLAYGLSKNLTMSLEGGYFIKKIEIGLHVDPLTTYQAKGMGDIILFPRYDVYNHTGLKTKTEVTVGLGYKIPLGSYNDSTGNVEPFSGNTYYVTKPLSVQLSSGAQDIIFYTFFFQGFNKQNFRIFANGLYVKKGWNPNGEKLGDFASVAVFAGKSFFKRLGVTLQARYEWVDKMKINENILLYGKPSNYFPEGTGYKKVFVTPMISYTQGNISVYISSDFPVYQFLNTSDYYTQVGSRHQSP